MPARGAILEREPERSSVARERLRRRIYNIIEKVNEDSTPIAITNNRGKGAVLVGEDDWAAIEETLYLMGIPGMAESLAEGKSERVEDCVPEDKLEW